MAQLIVGLGNPGKKYTGTRHNIGQMVFDHLSSFGPISWREKFSGLFASCPSRQEQLFLLKPTTYMNRSGESVQKVCAFYGISPEEVLVVHDEIDFPFGMLSFKAGGGTAGHNGLKSILVCLGSGDFNRLRLGVGRPLSAEEDVSDYVLSPFSGSQRVLLGSFLRMAAEGIEVFLEGGIQEAAKDYNKRSVVTEEGGDENGP